MHFFDGTVDEVHIYDKALSATEIAEVTTGRRGIDMMGNMIPCPFCGSGDVAHKYFMHYYVRCRDCGATGPDAFTKEEAARLWNSRPILAHYVKQVGQQVDHWRGRGRKVLTE